MIAVRKNEFIKFEDELSVERMELDVDTADELPEVDFLSGHRLYMGSIAWVIATGEFYAMQSDGTWVNQYEESEPQALNTASFYALESEVNDIEPLSETESDENRLGE